jgi:hypothetical protein
MKLKTINTLLFVLVALIAFTVVMCSLTDSALFRILGAVSVIYPVKMVTDNERPVAGDVCDELAAFTGTPSGEQMLCHDLDGDGTYHWRNYRTLKIDVNSDGTSDITVDATGNLTSLHNIDAALVVAALNAGDAFKVDADSDGTWDLEWEGTSDTEFIMPAGADVSFTGLGYCSPKVTMDTTPYGGGIRIVDTCGWGGPTIDGGGGGIVNFGSIGATTITFDDNDGTLNATYLTSISECADTTYKSIYSWCPVNDGDYLVHGRGPITLKCGSVSVNPASCAATTTCATAVATVGVTQYSACSCSPRAVWDDDLLYVGCAALTADNLTVRLYNPTLVAIDAAVQTVDYCCGG